MSLKAFHIFFITVSVLLALGFAAWSINGYLHEGEPMMLVAGIISFLAGVLLVRYGVRFLRKLKHVSFI